MSKNFWKLTTVGLAGYIIGRERRQMPYYSQAARYSPSYNTPYVNTVKSGIVTPILKRVEEKVSDILAKDGDIPRDVTKRIKAPRFVSKAAAHTFIDEVEEMANSYGYIRVADYLDYLRSNRHILTNDETEQNEFLKAYYTDVNYGWNAPLTMCPILSSKGDWMIMLPPVEKLKKWSERAKL